MYKLSRLLRTPASRITVEYNRDLSLLKLLEPRAYHQRDPPEDCQLPASEGHVNKASDTLCESTLPLAFVPQYTPYLPDASLNTPSLQTSR